MLTRRHRIIGILSAGSALYFLFFSGSRPAHHASNASTDITWANSVDSDSEKGFTLPDYSKSAAIIETTLPGNAPVPGFTIFDRLYVWNGTIYAVTSKPEVFPELRSILARPQPNLGHNSLEPTSRDMQIISPAQAAPFLGENAVVIEGMSFILYDTEQFMAHYYHWWGEIILGLVRIYSSLSLVPGIKTPLPEPSRFILPNVPDDSWRDRAGVNGPLMRAGFPSTSIEQMDFWEDLIKLNQTFVFERAMIVSRWAAHTSPLGSVWFKMISSTMDITVPARFWEPLRQRLVRHTISYLPILNNAGTIVSHPKSALPIVTYISRQGGGRRLTRESHDGLVKALEELADEGLCELDVVQMERISFSQQVEVAARTTIMVGLHGNGLTHQLWMPPSPRSTVIEIFFPKTYLHDYVMLSRNAGHKHYAVWNDTTLTFPEGEWFKGIEHGRREDLHGNNIPVHGPTVAQVIRERLTSPIP